MNLTPKEEERLTVFTAAELARRRLERGVALNRPEAVAYISDWCIERAREGESVADIRAGASQLLSREDVMDGVPEMIEMVQVEPVFPDGTKLVTVHDPVRSDPRSEGTAGANAPNGSASDDSASDGSASDGSATDRTAAEGDET